MSREQSRQGSGKPSQRKLQEGPEGPTGGFCPRGAQHTVDAPSMCPASAQQQEHLLFLRFACTSQHPPKALWGTDPFQGQMEVVVAGSDPTGLLKGGFRLVVK